MRFGSLRLQRAAGRFWGHRALRRLVPEFYFELWSVVRASVPLMDVAEREARSRPHEPGATALADYLARHREEERHHDEWLLDDMVAAGWSRPEALARLPSPEVAALVGTTYYYVTAVHPVALLGYLAVLEGWPPLLSELLAIERQTGLPTEAFRTLKKHAELDPSHSAELDLLLDSLPLSQAQAQCVSLTALATIDNVSTLLDAIRARTEGNAS